MEVSGLWSSRAHASLLFWMAGVIVIVFALIIMKIWDGWKNSLPTPPTAEQGRAAAFVPAACSTSHLPV
jgi:hypothetical protein